MEKATSVDFVGGTRAQKIILVLFHADVQAVWDLYIMRVLRIGCLLSNSRKSQLTLLAYIGKLLNVKYASMLILTYSKLQIRFINL